VDALHVLETPVVNLTVHGIGPAGHELAPGEEQTWVDVGRFEQVLDAAVGRSDVRLTFDDSNASDLDIALPRLIERGLTAQFFVLVGLLGQPGRLDRDGVRELQRAGMGIGSHGWAHRDWRRLTPEQAHEEITRAHDVLGGIVGQPVSRVAIPFGSYDGRVLARLRRARVARAYTSDGGRTRPGAWLQARNSLHHELDAAWIRTTLEGAAPLPVRARRLAGRVVKRVRR
jgi:peptidoglycan/xylan/chitin deacetylase (PgdA/CDA1 family)